MHSKPTTVNTDTRSLSPARRWLVQKMREAQFGTMHNLVFRDGEPVIDPPPKIKLTYKLGGRRNAPKVVMRDFVLKGQHLDLFDLMDDKQHGVITKLTIHDGLPLWMECEED